MNVQANSSFLSEVMIHLRQERPKIKTEPPFYNRVEKSREGNYVEVWFLTSGCQWDSHGGCTMCNYGQGPERTEDEIVDAVFQGLSAITVDVKELVVSPSGSMLNPCEVPVNARQRIYNLINDFPSSQFVFETRPETVTEEVVKELVQSIHNKRIGVEMGLESSNVWIQHFCVNKGIHPSQFSKAADILTKYGIDVYANISLGTAFLSPIEAINDAINSIQWAFMNGASISVLFPIHIKPYTLLAWLYQKGLYQQPSLWSLVEVLYQLGSVLMDRTEISWYRNYYNDKSKVIASPTTCPLCQEEVIALLDEYRDSRSPKVIQHLREKKCVCKEKWEEEIKKVPTSPLPERVLRIYKELAYDFFPNCWWEIHGKELQNNLWSEYDKL